MASSPPPPPLRLQVTMTSQVLQPQSWWEQLVAAWDSIQVELHGCYSVHRLQALHEYSNSSTSTRRLLVILLTPAPCLIAVAFADFIPLAPPELGLKHSGGFWVRACFATWVYAYSIMEQLRYFVPELPLTGWTTFALSIPVMILTNVVTFMLALNIGYPLPFTIPVLSMPWSFFMISALWLCLREYFRNNPDKKAQLLKFFWVVVCQVSLLIIYPAYNAVFSNLSSTGQVMFALLLPVIKLAEKNFLSFFLRHMEDIKPETIIFNIEIFNALFIACCMQNSNSIATNIVLVVVDFAMACISLRDLDSILCEVHVLAARANIDLSELQAVALTVSKQFPHLETHVTATTILERASYRKSQSRSPSRTYSQLRPFRIVESRKQMKGPVAVPSAGGFIEFLRGLRRARCSRQTEPETVTIIVPAKDPLNPVLCAWIDANGPSTPAKNGNRSRLPRNFPSPDLRSHSSSRIASLGALKSAFPIFGPRRVSRVSPVDIQNRPPINLELLSEPERVQILRKLLQALHLAEYLLLIEYVEVMIPIVYSIYLLVLFHLPNRTYYPQLHDMDEQKLQWTIGNVMMNGVLELISLVLLVRVLRRKLHISPFSQLAFVLDRQWRMVQSKVVLWVVVTLQSTLYHLGADYSFKFEWLHRASPKSPSSR